MRLGRPVGRLALLVGFGFGIGIGSAPGRSDGGDSPAERALKDKGLSKSIGVYVLEDEKPVLAKLKEAKAGYNAYATAAERQAMAEQAADRLARLEQQRANLSTQLDNLNLQLNAQGMGNVQGPTPGSGRGGFSRGGGTSPALVARNQVSSALAETTQEVTMVKSQAPQAKDRQALDEEVKKKEAAFKSALADLRPEVDAVTKKYADLAADASVKSALADLKKSTGLTAKLGPSERFLAASKELDQAERQFLGKKKAPAASKIKKKAPATSKKTARTNG